MDFFAAMGKKFEDAGIEIYAVNYSFRTTMSDPEIEAVRAALAERLGAGLPPAGVHYEVVDFVQR